MKAFVITLKNDSYSQQMADRCIASAKKFNVYDIEKFDAVDKDNAERVMKQHQLTWTWANNNTKNAICPITRLQQFPYTTDDLRKKIGCSMSHFLLWKKCVETNEPLMILEHDAVFINPMPTNLVFRGICQINDPAGCTRKGNWWSKEMINLNRKGTSAKTRITGLDPNIPDGLAGNSAYLIKPRAAKGLINKCYEVGLWPNDALMCIQLFPYLEQYYPFITKVVQTKSTTCG